MEAGVTLKGGPTDLPLPSQRASRISCGQTGPHPASIPVPWFPRGGDRRCAPIAPRVFSSALRQGGRTKRRPAAGIFQIKCQLCRFRDHLSWRPNVSASPETPKTHHADHHDTVRHQPSAAEQNPQLSPDSPGSRGGHLRSRSAADDREIFFLSGPGKFPAGRKGCQRSGHRWIAWIGWLRRKMATEWRLRFPSGQSGGLLHPARHLFLVEFIAFVDVDPARLLAALGAAGRDR